MVSGDDESIIISTQFNKKKVTVIKVDSQILLQMTVKCKLSDINLIANGVMFWQISF